MRSARTLVAIAALVIVAAGCKNAATNAAGAEYKEKLESLQGQLKSFDSGYGPLEDKLDAARESDAAKAQAIITGEMLPMLDGIIDALGSTVATGNKYVGMLDDDVSAKPKLAEQLATFTRQRDGYQAVRKTYVDEAALHAKGTPSEDAMRAIYEARVAAGKSIVGE